MNEKRVIRIDPIPVYLFDENNQVVTKKKRVCAYARVSTDSEDQLHSYNAQIQEYTKQIQRNDDWEFVDMYADEGTSGTSMKNRPEFLRMLEDSRNGKIDLIITKSLSRFARNTVDTLSVVQELRNLDVEIVFEKENLSSKDSKVDLMLTIFSSIAQEESRNISENVKWGIRKRYKDGNIRINTSRFLGYDKDEDKNIIINHEQAKTVKIIFNLYLSGASYKEICDYLIENNILNGRNVVIWNPANIMNILKNEKYCGDVLLQKYVTIDYLTHKSVKNTGQAPQYYIENNHEGIVTKELFNLVQLMIKERKNTANTSRYGKQYPLSGIVFCGSCKRVLNRKYYNYRTQYQKVVLTCKNTKHKKLSCNHLPIENETLEMVCSDVLTRLNIQHPNQINETIKTIEENFHSSKTLGSITTIESKISLIENEIRDLIKLRISDESNHNDKYLVKLFDEKKEQIETYKKEIEELNSKLLSNHVNMQRSIELQEFLSNNIILSRNALQSVIKYIIQLSNKEVIICMSDIDIPKDIFKSKIEELKNYIPISEGSVTNPKTHNTLNYKLIEYGDEIND